MNVLHFKSKRVFSAFFLFAALLMGIVGGSSIAHAESYHATPGGQQYTTNQCNRGNFDSKNQKQMPPQCFEASQPTPMNRCELESQQYSLRNDQDGNPAYWTYTNNTAACIDVTFDISALSGKNCTMYMYVPEVGNAGELLLYPQTSKDTKNRPITIDESQSYGWVPLPQLDRPWTDFQSIEFSDFDPAYSSLQIGWRINDGLGAICNK